MKISICTTFRALNTSPVSEGSEFLRNFGQNIFPDALGPQPSAFVTGVGKPEPFIGDSKAATNSC